MLKKLLAIMVSVVAAVIICTAYAESVPSPFQEVQATGQGDSADDALKQAVQDAVRQVVGTLVSSENVVKNEKVIKDEVLTLSNGFVEKLLSQDKTKLGDGTWQVKLKCIVRKGQLYGQLQKANVATVKFDGVSMFADVISQSYFRQDANKMLAKAVREFFRRYPSIYKYECGKPELVHAGDQTTKVNIRYRCSVDQEAYYNTLLPPLRDALKGVAKEAISITSDQLRKRNAALNPVNQYPGHRNEAQRAQDLADSRLGFQTIQESDATLSKIIVQERSAWSVFAIENEILTNCDLRTAFREHYGSGPNERPLLVRDATTFILFLGNDSAIPKYIHQKKRSSNLHGVEDIAFNGDCVVAAIANPQRGEDRGMSDITLELPTTLLPNITKITMCLGLNVSDFAIRNYMSEQFYNGFVDKDANRLFCSQGWLVYRGEKLEWVMTKGLSNDAQSAATAMQAINCLDIYYLGDSKE